MVVFPLCELFSEEFIVFGELAVSELVLDGPDSLFEEEDDVLRVVFELLHVLFVFGEEDELLVDDEDSLDEAVCDVFLVGHVAEDLGFLWAEFPDDGRFELVGEVGGDDLVEDFVLFEDLVDGVFEDLGDFALDEVDDDQVLHLVVVGGLLDEDLDEGLLVVEVVLLQALELALADLVLVDRDEVRVDLLLVHQQVSLVVDLDSLDQLLANHLHQVGVFGVESRV